MNVEHLILSVHYMQANELATNAPDTKLWPGVSNAEALAGVKQASRVTICMIILRSGFVVIGSSAPLNTMSFDQVYGQQLAYRDAINQLMLLEGYRAIATGAAGV